MIEAVAAVADEVERAAGSELGRLDRARGELEVGLEPYVRREASSDVEVAPRWQFLQVAAEVTDPRANLSREEIPAVITARSRPPTSPSSGMRS